MNTTEHHLSFLFQMEFSKFSKIIKKLIKLHPFYLKVGSRRTDKSIQNRSGAFPWQRENTSSSSCLNQAVMQNAARMDSWIQSLTSKNVFSIFYLFRNLKYAFFIRQLGCLAFSLRFRAKIKQFFSNCPASSDFY